MSAYSDTITIAQRNMRALTRQPQLLAFVFVQPILFVLLFRYVFGGAIRDVPGGRYVDYLLPGIITQVVTFGATGTAVAFAEDMRKGIIDRFRALPMSRAAVVAGRVLADIARLAFTASLMSVVGVIVGWRPQGSALELLAAFLLALAFGQALSWMSAFLGLGVGSAEAAQALSFIGVFPLVFASSIFVPVQTMPGWLQGFAKVNPITLVASSVRSLTMGTPAGDTIWQAALWLIGLTALFSTLAVRRYRHIS